MSKKVKFVTVTRVTKAEPGRKDVFLMENGVPQSMGYILYPFGGGAVSAYNAEGDFEGTFVSVSQGGHRLLRVFEFNTGREEDLPKRPLDHQHRGNREKVVEPANKAGDDATGLGDTLGDILAKASGVGLTKEQAMAQLGCSAGALRKRAARGTSVQAVDVSGEVRYIIK